MLEQLYIFTKDELLQMLEGGEVYYHDQNTHATFKMVDEKDEVIADLTKCNQELAERVAKLENMRQEALMFLDKEV